MSLNTRLTRRIRRSESRGKIIGMLIDKAGYPALTFVALWASARFSDYGEQFLTLAIILGWKWICSNQTQVIQIFTQEAKEYQ